MIKLAGLFALVAALGIWIFFAGSVLGGVGSGGSLLGTASPTSAIIAEPTTVAPIAVRPAATGSPAPASTVATPRATAAAAEPTAAPPEEARPAFYTVVAGDNLTRIASRFGITLDALERANSAENLAPVRIGQVLVIPPR